MRYLTLVLFLAIFVCAYLLSNKPPGSRQELEKQEARYKRDLDSLSDVNTALRLKDSLLVVSMGVKWDSLSQALKQAQNQAAKYAKIKPLIRPTDAQLDSAIARLYPR